MIGYIVVFVIGAVLGYLFALWEVWTDRKLDENERP